MPSDPDCLFCKIVAGEIPSTRVDEDERTVAFMDINPATRGHLLVIPREHSVDLLEVPGEDLDACARMAKKLAVRAEPLDLARRELLRGRDHRPEVAGIDPVQVARVRPRDDEQVAARRRVDVHERDRALVLGHDRRGDLARDDLAEQAVRVGGGGHRRRSLDG